MFQFLYLCFYKKICFNLEITPISQGDFPSQNHFSSCCPCIPNFPRKPDAITFTPNHNYCRNLREIITSGITNRDRRHLWITTAMKQRQGGESKPLESCPGASPPTLSMRGTHRKKGGGMCIGDHPLREHLLRRERGHAFQTSRTGLFIYHTRE